MSELATDIAVIVGEVKFYLHKVSSFSPTMLKSDSNFELIYCIHHICSLCK